MKQLALQPYQVSSEKVLQQLKTTPSGLNSSEAKQRLERYGLNRLTPPQPPSALQLYLAQLKSGPVVVLLGATILILLMWLIKRDNADLVDVLLILAIIVITTTLGFFQEFKAEQAVQSLKKLLAYQAKVWRDGREQEVTVEQLVPGDIVILEEGMRVPADIRLVTVAELQVDEQSLTGESTAVSKITAKLAQTKSVADQKNMVFSGTVVTQGRGTGVVVQTGNQTQIGQIATNVAGITDEITPIQQRLNRIGRTLAFGVLTASVTVFIFIVFLAPEFTKLPLVERVAESLVAAVALAVAAIPEGLPAVVSITLALGTRRMLKRRALIRKLASAETLGSTDIICVDKTGTLTKGEMTVQEIYFDNQLYHVSGSGYEPTGQFRQAGTRINPAILRPILEIGSSCNNAVFSNEQLLGDPTEIALIVAARKAGLTEASQRLQELPFSSQRKMMSVVIKKDNDQFVHTKGAPETVLAKCSHWLKNGQAIALTDDDRQLILRQTTLMSRRALRTLGFAYKKLLPGQEIEEDLIFVGLQGMIDPPRPEVKSLISRCQQSGIKVIMITGDHAATATAIAQEIGLTGQAVTEDELRDFSDQAFTQLVKQQTIYARVNPNFKMKIVETLRNLGHIVAMTGDGVNDAPALKRADIGIAMGKTGTDVAKEASDMILLDDQFATIVAAVEEGRSIFENIRKFINYLLTGNLAEVLTVFVAILIFQDVILSAVMLLWINIVTDGLPAVALGSDPARPDIMKDRPQQFQEDILSPSLRQEIIWLGTLIASLTLGVYTLNLNQGITEARTAAFTALVAFQLFRLFGIRAKYHTTFFSNPWLIAAVGCSLGLHLLLLNVPFLSNIFRLTTLDLFDWLLIGTLGLIIWVVSLVLHCPPSTAPLRLRTKSLIE